MGKAVKNRSALEDAHYKRAQRDPIASRVLKALHEQDARTYNGNAGDIGALALQTANSIRSYRRKMRRAVPEESAAPR